MTQKILGQETVCPKCGAAFVMNVDIGDGYFYDICMTCGNKRKKKPDGQEVEIDTTRRVGTLES